VTFSSSPDQICIPISISDDEVVEETESFTVTVDSEDPAVQLTLPNASVIIVDRSSKYAQSVYCIVRNGISFCVAAVMHVCAYS